MSSPAQPLVYLILGLAGSGRREVLADLLDEGPGPDGPDTVLLASDEAPDAADARLPNLTRWTWASGTIAAPPIAGAGRVFFVTSGHANPVDQVEAFKPWLDARGGEFARAICVVHCHLAEQHPPLLAWYEACIHFADAVLLNRREGVANKWMSDFRTHFQKQFYPCLFEFVKAGRVANPALVLEPQARRVSHLFDEEQEWIFTDADGEVIDEQEETDDEEGVTAAPAVDPYLARDAGGRRVKKVPELAKYLG